MKTADIQKEFTKETGIEVFYSQDDLNVEYLFWLEKKLASQQRLREGLKDITIDEADVLVFQTDYATEAAHTDINPINWGDASAFFIEGYSYAKKQLRQRISELELTNK